MKKVYLSLSLMLSSLCFYGQNWVNGGNTLSANGTIGTNSSHSLLFETAGVERGRITNGGNWGIGSTGTSSRFTVNAVTGASPFRAQVNGGTKFIVGANGGVSIGTANAGPANGLYVIGNVGVGTATPAYKIHVVGGSATAIYASGSTGVFGSGTSYGVYANGGTYGTFSYGTSYGIYASGGGTGVFGYGSSYGISGSSGYIGTYGTANSFGIYGASSYTGTYGKGTSYGTAGEGSYGMSANGTSYGIWAQSGDGYAFAGRSTNGQGANIFSTNNTGLVAGTDRTDKNWAAIFNGNVYAYGVYSGSDKALKKNIEPLGDAMQIIAQLKPAAYEFEREGKLAGLRLPGGKHYGLIAQELEEVLPSLVKESAFSTDMSADGQAASQDGKNQAIEPKKRETVNLKSVNYIELIPILIAGMQELQEENRRLSEEIELLKQNGIGDGTITGAWMKQNVPNPIKSSTTIQYNIPDNIRSARILITNAKGQQLKIYNVSGSGTVNFAAGTLPSGTYNYTLVADGKTISTKKLVIAR